jgi:hypothetical protein
METLASTKAARRSGAPSPTYQLTEIYKQVFALSSSTIFSFHR